MRMSKMHLKTLREVPAEAEIPSHILLLRSGMIRKLVSGVYGYMPLGKRALAKIENIVREEMDNAGGEEILMSAIQPSELWEESGRWGAYGPELWRLKDRNGREFCLGPTHEEIFTDIIRTDVNSYRQLPLMLYQIQTKYRDEARPRFGLMRSREFIMKDLYSFDRDEEALDKSYQIMYNAYDRIFKRCGLECRPVEADTGAIGGSNSHEFTALSDIGESEIVYCTGCDMAANIEKAKCVDEEVSGVNMLETNEVHTPNTKTIEELADFLKIEKKDTLKALMFRVYNEVGEKDYFLVAFIRGDRELNIIKLVNALGIPEHAIEFADEEEVASKTGCVPGFTGPIGLRNCKIAVDSEVLKNPNLVSGANKKDYHVENVNYERDFKANIIADLKTLMEGEPCPECGGKVLHKRGIEVGQVFKLGTKYSKSLGAYYRDEQQKEQLIHMGCYGIGVSRTLAAVVEQCHDDKGIVWPVSVAPYEAIITIVKDKDENQVKEAERIYSRLKEEGIDVLLDDRKERPGVKFKDAELLGVPVAITVGRGATEGKVEYKLRREEEKQEMVIEDAISTAVQFIKRERKMI